MSKRVPVRVPEAKLNDWDEHVESHTSIGTDTPVYDSRSQFIKYAVEQQIKRDNGETNDNNTVDETGDERLDTVVETVERLSNRIEDIEETVENATATMRSGGVVPSDVATDVYAAIPTEPERATTAEGIAQGTNHGVETVRLALQSLHSNTGSDVQRREIQQIEEGDGTKKITTQMGQEIEIEDTGTAIRRRNPLWWRKA